MKLKVYLVLFALVFMPFLLFAQDETLTISTYYPSPYGSYNQFKVAADTWLAYSSGKVGIGTTSPQGVLFTHLTTNKNIRFSLETEAAIGGVNDLANAFVPLKIDASALYLNSQSTGNVGIGTTGPNWTLETVGRANIGTASTFPGLTGVYPYLMVSGGTLNITDQAMLGVISTDNLAANTGGTLGFGGKQTSSNYAT